MACPVVMHPDPANLSPRAKSRSRQCSPSMSRQNTLGTPRESSLASSPRFDKPLQNFESLSQGEVLAEAFATAMQREFSIIHDSMNSMKGRIADQDIWFESQFSQMKALQLRVLDGLHNVDVNRNSEHLDSEIPAEDGLQKDKSKAPVDKPQSGIGNASSASQPTLSALVNELDREITSVSAPVNEQRLAEDLLFDFTAWIKQGLEQLAVKLAGEIKVLLAHSHSSSGTSDSDSSSTVDRPSQQSGNDGLPQQISVNVNDDLPQQKSDHRLATRQKRSVNSESLRDDEFKAGLSHTIYGHEGRSVTLQHVITETGTLKAQTKADHQRFLYRFAVSKPFTAACILVVILNGIWVGYEVDSQSSGAPGWMTSVSLSFNIWFIVELAIKIAGLRTDFILGPDWSWNCLDAFCVIISIPDFFASSINVSILRILRLSKLSKTLRLMRVVKVFRSLKEILATVFFTLGSLFWSFVAMLFAAYVFAILLIQALYFDGDGGVHFGSKMAYNFGSLWRTILTLFSFITAGQEWFDFAMEFEEGGFYIAKFVLMFWMYFALFGLVNVVVAVFCARAVEAQESQHDLRLEKQMETREAKISDLIDVFHMIDTENCGMINWQQFHDFAIEEEGRAICESHGLSLLALEPLWHVMVGNRDKDALVDTSSFVMGFLRLSNDHLNSDLLLLSHAVKALRRELKFIKGGHDITKKTEDITEHVYI